MSVSNKGPNVDPRLQNLTNSLYLDGNDDVVVRTGFAGDIIISGNVNVPGTIAVESTPENPVHNHITEVGTSGVLDVPYLPVSGNVVVTSIPSITGNVNANVSGTVALDGASLSALEHVSIDNFPSSFNIGTMPEVEIKNDSGNPVPVTGTVSATITDVITVTINEDAGELFAFNNHATAVHRGWVMDDVMRPMVSIRINPATTTSATLMKIVEYELGNNNANQSTIMYEWYEGDLTFAGAAIPAWTSVNGSSQYRIYQDVYSSNQGNTFTVPAGTFMRHSGIIIGKNSDGDSIEKPLYGGNTGKMLTLCMKRLDNATKLDVWFSFTLKEIA